MRPRNPWRKPGNSFRIGQRGPSPPSLDEQRITLYLPSRILDEAEDQAQRAGDSSVQVYCARLLESAIEAERGNARFHEVDAKGGLAGLKAISDDPEYLAEWVASAAPRDHPDIVEPEVAPAKIEPALSSEARKPMPEGPSPAAQVIMRHSTVSDNDPDAFLATLRRGDPVAEAASAELLQALNALEVEYRNAASIDRKVAYALHRLAFEGQVLHTDAWPGRLDASTVDTLRIVQEAVDRVLSGEDIRYYPAGN